MKSVEIRQDGCVFRKGSRLDLIRSDSVAFYVASGQS